MHITKSLTVSQGLLCPWHVYQSNCRFMVQRGQRRTACPNQQFAPERKGKRALSIDVILALQQRVQHSGPAIGGLLSHPLSITNTLFLLWFEKWRTWTFFRLSSGCRTLTCRTIIWSAVCFTRILWPRIPFSNVQPDSKYVTFSGDGFFNMCINIFAYKFQWKNVIVCLPVCLGSNVDF